MTPATSSDFRVFVACKRLPFNFGYVNVVTPLSRVIRFAKLKVLSFLVDRVLAALPHILSMLGMGRPE
jgi:hypothetical protein